MSGGRIWGPRLGTRGQQIEAWACADPETWSGSRDSGPELGWEGPGQVDEETKPRGEEQALRPEPQGLSAGKPMRAGAGFRTALAAPDEAALRGLCWTV